jgi:hypothetical protein
VSVRHGGGRPHPLGFCTCRTHLRRAWHRPEHWRADEVAYLEAQFGRQPDEQIARHLPHACTARAGIATAPTGRASRGGWLRSLAGLPRTRLAPVGQREMA